MTSAQKIYDEILDRLTPEQKLLRVFELSELGRELYKTGLRMDYPDLSEEEFHQLYLTRLLQCHNKNY